MIVHIFILAFLMRVKGGGPDMMPQWFRDLRGIHVSSLGVAIYSAQFYELWQAPLMGLVWLLHVMSMGEESGAIGGIYGNWFGDKDSWFGSKYLTWIKNKRLWGWVSSALRGFIIGIALALVSLNPWFILAGISFPLCYFVGISIEQIVKNKNNNVSWHWAEWIYGGVFGLVF